MIYKGKYEVSNKMIALALGLPDGVEIQLVPNPIKDVVEIKVLSTHQVQGFTWAVSEAGEIPEIDRDRLQIAWMEKTKKICSGGWNELSEAALQKLKDKFKIEIIDDMGTYDMDDMRTVVRNGDE